MGQMKPSRRWGEQNYHQQSFRNQYGNPDIVKLVQADKSPGDMVDPEDDEHGELDCDKQGERSGNEEEVVHIHRKIKAEVQSEIKRSRNDEQISAEKEEETLQRRWSEQLSEQGVVGIWEI